MGDGAAGVPGRLSIAPRVVEKIAAQAVGEVPHAAGVPRRLFGHGRGTAGGSTAARPSAKVDGPVALVSLGLSVDYPHPTRDVAAEVRGQITRRLAELCGLRVARVDIDIPALRTDAAASRESSGMFRRRRASRVV
jgi:uncharacterized alkaline shock family protein YloU